MKANPKILLSLALLIISFLIPSSQVFGNLKAVFSSSYANEIAKQSNSNYTYTPSGNVLSYRDINGDKTHYTYDPLGRVSQESKGEREITYTYEPENRISTQTTNWGATSSYTYTTDGKLLTVTHPNGFEEKIKYDGFDRPIYTLTEEGETVITYDDEKNTVETTLNGEKSIEVFDALGRIKQYTDANGGTYHYTYNFLNDITSITSPNGEVTRYDYAYEQNLKIITYPDGTKERIINDMLGRPKGITYHDATEKLIETIKYTYSDDGFVTITQKGTGGSSVEEQSIYNHHGQIVKKFFNTIDGSLACEVLSHDRNGNLIAHLSSRSDSFSYYSYNDKNQIKQIARATDGYRVTFEYDIAGNLIEINFPGGLNFKATYDLKTGEKLSEALVAGSSKDRLYTYTYAPHSSKLLSVEDPRGMSFKYDYDANGRTTRIQSTTGETSSYEYDANDNLILISRTLADGTTVDVKRTYDIANNLAEESIWIDGELHQSATQRFASGQRSAFSISTHSGATHSCNFAYNAAGRLAKFYYIKGNYPLVYDYNDAGLLNSLSDATLVRFFRDYTPDGKQPTVINTYISRHLTLNEKLEWFKNTLLTKHCLTVSGLPIACRNYTYTPEAKLQSEKDFVQEAFRMAGSYTKDLLGILKERSFCGKDFCAKAAVLEQLANKVFAERFEKAAAEGIVYADAAAHSREHTCENTFDGAGNLASKTLQDASQGLHFTWNAWGELVRVDGVAFTWEAIYDGLGRRLKTVYTPMGGESVETLSYYDPAVAFLEIGVEVEGETAWKVYGLDLDKTYGGLQGIGGLRAIIQDGNVIRIIDDVQGNVLGYVDTDNKITWNSVRDYDAYGPLGELESGGCEKSLEKLLDSNSLSIALFKAHVWRGKRQEVNGLVYFGKRYYDPTTGRFISPDPLGHSGSIDLYSYANGDPVNFVDPSGMFACAAMEGVKATAEMLTPFYQSSQDLTMALTGTHLGSGQQLSAWDRAIAGTNGILGAALDALTLGKGSGAAKAMALYGTSAIGRVAGMGVKAEAQNVALKQLPGSDLKQALKYLKDMGVGKIDRKRIISTFVPETLKVKIADGATYAIRFHDEFKAQAMGQYLTPTFSSLSNRNNLALPFEFNRMTGISQWQIRPGTLFIEGKVAPQLKYGSQFIGGSDQIFILKPWIYNTLIKP